MHGSHRAEPSGRAASNARLETLQLDAGRWTRASREPHPLVRPLLARDYMGFHQESAQFEQWLEPPPPALTLIVDLEGRLRADGVDLPAAWIGGLDRMPSLVELFGRNALRFVDRLLDATSWDARFDLLDAFLLECVLDKGELGRLTVNPGIDWAWSELLGTAGRVRIGTTDFLARRLAGGGVIGDGVTFVQDESQPGL